MKEYRNNKGYEVKETGRYRRTCFVDTEFNRILYNDYVEQVVNSFTR